MNIKRWGLTSVWTVALGALCWAQAASAALLDDTYNPEQPVLAYDNTGTLVYRPWNDKLTVDAEALSIILDDMFSPISNGDVMIRVFVDDMGNLIGGVDGHDLRVTGDVTLNGTLYSGMLLRGEVTAFGFEDLTDFVDSFDFRFDVTGGKLKQFFGDQVGLKLTSEQSNFTGSFRRKFNGEAKGNIGPLSEPCELFVFKTCEVLVPVSADWDCTKPIDALTMVYNGAANNVTVKGYKGDTGDDLLDTVSGVNPGDEVTISGFAGSPNDVTWEIFDEFGNKLGESQFHLSCSDNEMDGPEDCGLPQGDGKSNESGLLNDWLLEGIVDAGGVLNCTADDSGPGDHQCEIPSAEGELCTTKPTSMSFLYRAHDDCSDSDNNQDDGKWSCSGSAAGEPVRIRVTNGNGDKVYLDTGPGATVGDGDVVVAPAANAGQSDYESETRMEILNDDGHVLQEIELHTSCSQDLGVGDRYGALEVVGFTNDEQGTVQSGAEVKYRYLVKNTGDVDLTGITVEDDGLDPTTVPGSPIDLLAGQATVPPLMATTFVSDPFLSTVTVTAVTPAGQCEATSRTGIIVAEPPPCVILPDEFTLEDDKIKWKLTNDGDDVATVESIEISAPNEFGEIDKVKLDGDVFKDFTRPMTWTFTEADFVDKDGPTDLDKRQIKAGDTKELTFETTHQFDHATADDISITVNFVEGCSITFVPGLQAFDCSDAKPIDSLSMFWQGDVPVVVSAAGQIANVDTVGQEVSFSGLSGMGNDVVWTISGAENGVSTFHVSCSDSAMNGPEDCGTPQGDGKSDDKGLNLWSFEGMAGTNGIGFDCSALP